VSPDGLIGVDRVAGRPDLARERGRAVANRAAAEWEPRGTGPSRGVRGSAPLVWLPPQGPAVVTHEALPTGAARLSWP